MLGNRKDSKIARLDIRATFNDGEDCDIEIQVQPYEHMDKRMLEYWASMYSAKINKGDGYDVLKPSIVILITNYKMDKLKCLTKYHTIWNLREQNYHDLILTDEIEFHILELPKLKNIHTSKDELALWLKFIQNPSNKEVQSKMYNEENKVLRQAERELAYLSGEPNFKRLVEARAGAIRDQNTRESVARKKGEKKGKEKGQREEKIKIAKKLLLENINIEKISEITELSIEEINKLI